MKCYHCGLKCLKHETVFFKSHPFCCSGCKAVYQIINDNNLDQYYEMNPFPGKLQNSSNPNYYDVLDSPEIQSQFVLFENDNITRFKLSIPQIHCSSCLWLLENLKKLNPHILFSDVNFYKKEVSVTLEKPFSLKEFCVLLDEIGYKPELKKNTNPEPKDKTIYYKIGVAGFCFGNIMLLSFADYLNVDSSLNEFRSLFGYISIILSLPTFFYSGNHYLIGSFKSIRKGLVNMDTPIALGMITLFIRSSYEILSQTGNGYFDSLSGFIFFLLIGKFIQKRTYDNLVFNRDYKSYFPVGVNCIKNGRKIIKKIEDLEPEEIVSLRPGELIPADGVLYSDKALINYSFVTGESDPLLIEKNKNVFAGGIISGKTIEILLKRKVDNSYLTQLWNQNTFSKNNSQKKLEQINNKTSKFFTQAVIAIAIFSGLFWHLKNPDLTWNVTTSVLIVFCPCALALSAPLTFGNIMQIMGELGLYLKNSDVIEDLSKTTDIVLDKTGTITHNKKSKVTYKGNILNKNEKLVIFSVTSNSIHPMSNAIQKFLNLSKKPVDLEYFKEFIGEGIEGGTRGLNIKLGSSNFLNCSHFETKNKSTQIYISINNVYKGFFSIEQHYREGLDKFVHTVKNKFDLHLLSGDTDKEKDYLKKRLGTSRLLFNLNPIEKMDYIKSLQNEKKVILMLGDGLNDTGALKQSNVGISISDNIHNSLPACDAILESSKLSELGSFINFSKKGLKIVKWSLFISLVYNSIGLYFAVTGKLSPVIAAILMPISAISVAFFTSFTTYLSGRKFSSKN